MHEINQNSILVPSDSCVVRQLQGDFFIIPLKTDSDDDSPMTMDSVGKSIWDKYRQDATLGEIINELLEEYSGPRDVITKDVLDFSRLLIAKGLLDIHA